MCPNITNKQIIQEFNEIVEALGGTPLSIEEFKDSELRKNRKGIEYAAMEAAYTIWDLNNGNAIDCAPNGALSELFKTLLSLNNGDRKAAIKSKSKVYSKSFRKWFGDWTLDDKSDVSKVVDGNGEPLIVYHGTTDEFTNTNIFNKDKTNVSKDDLSAHIELLLILGMIDDKAILLFNNDLLYFDGYYFTIDYGYAQAYASRYSNGFVIPSFLNIKNVKDMNQSEVNKEIDSYGDNINHQSVILLRMVDYNGQTYDGMIGDEEDSTSYVVFNSNQIKSATNNNGKFSKKNDNIYSLISPDFYSSYQTNGSLEFVFGSDLSKMLEDKEDVASDMLINQLLSADIINSSSIHLAKLLQSHKIPIIIDYNMTPNKIAETIVDKDGSCVVIINPNVMSGVSREYAITAILHEVVHAVTVNAIDNPQNAAESRFAGINRKTFNTFRKLLPKNISMLSDVYSGLYAFSNEKEFAAVYMSDPTVRSVIRSMAKQADIEKNGKLLSMIKKFVNSLVHLFSSKSPFKTNIDALNTYQNEMDLYLKNVSNIEVDKNSKLSNLILQYKNIDGSMFAYQSAIDFFNRVENYENALKSNALMIGPLVIERRKSETLNYSYKEVADMLHTRLKALRASSKDQIADKDRLILETSGLIEMFTNEFTSKYSAINDLVRVIGPQILSDTDELRSKYNNDLDIAGEEYMYQAHANIGMFEKLTSTLIVILDDQQNVLQMIDFYNRDKAEADKISYDDIEALKNNVNTLNGICKEGQAVVKRVLDKITGNALQKIRNDVGASDLDSYINRLASGDPILDDDVSALEVWGGAADSSSSPILRSLAYILGKAKENAEHEALHAMEELLEVSKGLNLTKIYEKADGKFTSYLIRKLNYGKFYSDYDKAMVLINETINKKYNLDLDKDSRIAPQNNEDARIEWNVLRNNWLDGHALRRYNLRYYNAWAKLPEVAKQALASYNNEISMILKNPSYIEGDRVIYEKISDEDWTRLQHLWTLKKLLRSDYDMFGNKKEEGTEAYNIAQALKLLDKDLYGVDDNGRTNRPIPNKNRDGWLQARNQAIKDCGGIEAYNKYLDGLKDSESGFNSKRFEKWDRRNSIRTLKREDPNDPTSKPLVFKKIDELMRGLNVNYGDEYDNLTTQANDLLKPFRDDKGEVIATELPESVKNLLLEIYHKQTKIKKRVLSNNKGAQKIAQRRAEIMKEYVKYVDTEYFKLIKDQIEESLLDDEDDLEMYDPVAYDDFYNLMLSDYGTEIVDYDTGDIIDVIPYKWLTKIEALNEEYMTYEPGNAWIEHRDDSQFINTEFERLSKIEGNQNVSMIPKSDKYENKEYDRVMSDYKYKKLYDATLALNKKANEKQTNRQYTDDYMLPLISGTLGDRLRFAAGAKSKPIIFFNWIREKLGVSYNPEDDESTGLSFAADYSTDEVDLKFDKHKNNLRGKYPDGRSFNIVPQYYTRRMKDPSIISTDLLNIMFLYYLMSASYEQKSKVRGECDALLDILQYKRFNDTNNDTLTGGENSDESNIYKAARKFLEMNLYNVRRQEISVKKLGVTLKYTKSLELWKEYSTAVNLGANPKVALVGMFTSSYVHLINMIVGSIPGVHYHYSIDTGIKAFKEVMQRLFINNIGSLRYIGNKRTNDKLMLLMEECDLSNQMSRKFKYSDRNRGLGVISNNYVYGFMTMADFFIKSQIMTSEYMSYRFVDGEFITKTDIYYNRNEYGEKLFNHKLKEFKNAKSLYSVLNGKNNKLYCDPLYRLAWEKIRYVVKNRAQKTAENADGMATQLQRNALTQNIIGALILMHRQYLPLMLQEAYGKTVYDYDTLRYKNGQFRSVFNLTMDLMKGNLLAGITSGATIGYALGGPIGSVALGLIAAPVLRAYGIRQGHAQTIGFKKCISEYFSNFSSTEKSHQSYSNRANVAKTVVEILLFNLLTLPAITAICKAYDDDDRWYIQFLLYCLRAFAWEAYTKYRTAELFNNIRTATAATSSTDKLMEFASQLNQFVDPRLASGRIISYDGILDEVQSGAYEGWNKILKFGFKLTPWHNTYEQYKDPKAKRKYNETLIQKLPESER